MIKARLHFSFLPEQTYALHVLLSEILGLPFVVEIFEEGPPHCTLTLPNGYCLTLKNTFFGQSHPDKIAVQYFNNPFSDSDLVVLWGTPTCYVGAQNIEVGIDLLAATFFMLTRIEEAASDGRDQYGRFPAHKALATRFDFLHRPVVNEWAAFLLQCLLKLGWPSKAHTHRKFRTVLSCDVDHPRLWWSPLDTLKTLGGAFFRKNTLEELRYWSENWLWTGKDPFDTFIDLMDLGKNTGAIQFNFLGDRPRHFDAWYHLQHPVISNLMQSIVDRGHTIGFHPSRAAAKDEDVFRHEIQSIRAISPAPVTSGRHHFLCFDANKTWSVWEKNNLLLDSTLGYPELPGFRCGICVEFPVFDTSKRLMLRLREQPLVAMDVTFARYMGLTAEATFDQLQQLKNTVRKYNGDFTLLWHNSSLNTPFWRSFRPVLEQILL